jgi:hypothetical protein
MAEAAAQAQTRRQVGSTILPCQQRRIAQFGKMMVLDGTQLQTMETARRACETFEKGFGGQQLRNYSIKATSESAKEHAEKPVNVNPEMTRTEREERWFAARFVPM